MNTNRTFTTKKKLLPLVLAICTLFTSISGCSNGNSGKTNEEAGRLVAGPGVFICDECIEVCYNMLNQKHIHTPKAKKEENI